MLKLTIKPTAGLTFRRMPSSILHISTYPFLTPTTMSGFLRRLKLLEAGHLPKTEVKIRTTMPCLLNSVRLGRIQVLADIVSIQRSGRASELSTITLSRESFGIGPIRKTINSIRGNICSQRSSSDTWFRRMNNF